MLIIRWEQNCCSTWDSDQFLEISQSSIPQKHGSCFAFPNISTIDDCSTQPDTLWHSMWNSCCTDWLKQYFILVIKIDVREVLNILGVLELFISHQNLVPPITQMKRFWYLWQIIIPFCINYCFLIDVLQSDEKQHGNGTPEIVFFENN